MRKLWKIKLLAEQETKVENAYFAKNEIKWYKAA